MKMIKSFSMRDRYFYDFKQCTPSKGYAQIDTEQDFYGFGMWTNPFTLTTVSYIEGDEIVKKAANVEEYVTDLEEQKQWYIDNELNFAGIDVMCNKELAKEFEKLDMLHLYHKGHPSYKEKEGVFTYK